MIPITWKCDLEEGGATCEKGTGKQERQPSKTKGNHWLDLNNVKYVLGRNTSKQNWEAKDNKQKWKLINEEHTD